MKKRYPIYNLKRQKDRLTDRHVSYSVRNKSFNIFSNLHFQVQHIDAFSCAILLPVLYCSMSHSFGPIDILTGKVKVKDLTVLVFTYNNPVNMVSHI